jgi:2-oxoglutarate dehydrogenase E2 component (dihydrolipoamide succinyltransferase)
MAVDVQIPAVGESITEGTLARWLKREGEFVKEGEPLLELETDKATGELPAPASGTLHITVKEGETVAIGAVVGRIEESTAPAAKPEPAKAPPADKAPPPKERAQERPAAPPPRARPPEPAQERPEPAQERQEPPPAAAREAPPPEGRETRKPMSRLRRTIAERLVTAQQTAALLTTFNEADMTQVLAARSRYKEQFQERHGVGLGLMSFFIKAAVSALKAFPAVNAWIDKDEVVYHHYYDIGVAVSTERGLMVPVVRDADRKTFAEIERDVEELARKGREGTISIPELRGGTFTITNGGVFGSLLSTPIVNPPQSAILGMHAIQKRPVVVSDAVVVRPMMYLALTYDHRLIDGREAVLFLRHIKECIEDPQRLLLGV